MEQLEWDTINLLEPARMGGYAKGAAKVANIMTNGGAARYKTHGQQMQDTETMRILTKLVDLMV